MEIRWIRHDKVTSTNRYLMDILKHQKVEEGLVVIADYQEAGKGQGTKSWHSEEGKNLLMSVLLFPAFLSASQQFQLSRLVSVAICEVLLSHGLTSFIKWPNDILVAGGKIAGILIEHGISGGTISYTIAGIGLNLNQKVFPEFPQPASSLFLETGRITRPGEVAAELMKRISFRYQELQRQKQNELEKVYLGRLFLLGESSMFEVQGKTFEGTVRGVSPLGELLVERSGKVGTYAHGEIVLKGAYRAG